MAQVMEVRYQDGRSLFSSAEIRFFEAVMKLDGTFWPHREREKGVI
jgi:hypothetical protein